MGKRSLQIHWRVKMKSSPGGGGGVQRDGWPIAPSYISANAGGGGWFAGLSNEYNCAHGAQINFGYLTPYLTYVRSSCLWYRLGTKWGQSRHYSADEFGQGCGLTRKLFFKGGFFYFSFYVRYSTMFHLPPLRFHCVAGCWDQTQDFCDFGIDSPTL